jgi:hypothetical protein
LLDEARTNGERIEALAATNEQLRALGEVTPPAELRARVSGHLEAVHRLLGRGLPDALQRRLERVACEAEVLAAHHAFRLADRQAVRWHLELADALAVEAEDRLLLASVLTWTASMVHSAAISGGADGDPIGALRLMDEAVQVAGPRASPQAVTALRAIRAEQHAVLGDTFNCLIDLAAAEDTMAAWGPWEGGIHPPATPTELAAMKGNCLLLLGRFAPEQAREAAEVLEGVHAELAPARRSWRATVLADAGAAYAEQGEIEQAARVVLSALEQAEQAGARHNVRRIAGIRAVHLHGTDGPALRELDDRLRR